MSEQATTLEILRRVRKRISAPEHWTQASLAKTADCIDCDGCDERAVCWCLMGAIRREVGPGVRVVGEPPYIAIKCVIGDDTMLSEFNDTHSHGEVLAVVDAAISAEEAWYRP